MRTKEPPRRVRRRAVPALSACKLQFLQVSPWKVFFFLAVVCLLSGYGMVLLAERGSVGEVDRKFLDDVVRQQSQDAQTLSAPGRNIGATSEIASSQPAVLRAELVVNSAIVRRGELVVHGGIDKHSGSSITTSRRNSQAATESGRHLN